MSNKPQQQEDIHCQLMFGPFLAPSSTVEADESQERTKTFLTHFRRSAGPSAAADVLQHHHRRSFSICMLVMFIIFTVKMFVVARYFSKSVIAVLLIHMS